MANGSPSTPAAAPLSAGDRQVILAVAFLGWMFAGVQMGIMPLATGPATVEFIRRGHFAEDSVPTPLWSRLWPAADVETPPNDATVDHIKKMQMPKWYAWYGAAFLFGAATGGLLFGWLGDRAGRVKALSLSILCYSVISGLSYFAQTPEQLLALRFLAAMGVGGMWPAGVALASEAWSDVSRPMLASLIGASANFGIILTSAVGYYFPLTPVDWRWMLVAGASSTVLGLFVWCCVRESPGWLAQRHEQVAAGQGIGAWQVFQPPLLKLTLLGICLGTVPLLGGWGTTSWVIPWADAVNPADPQAKAVAAIMRSTGGAAGSLLGGWLANLLGRRTTYFLVSLCSLLLSGYIFRFLTPHDPWFSAWVFGLGFISTIFFGWLPLYLPELFPTQARATGTGVAFNFGRIATAAGVLGTGLLMAHYQGNYAQVGQVTSLIYAAGMVIILFAPDTSSKRLGY